MKKILLLSLFLFTLKCYSQISFEKGYFIDNSGTKIECLIKNIDWRYNPSQFEYKLSGNANIVKATIDSVSEFGIYDQSKFIRAKVDVDISSDDIDHLSSDPNPIFVQKTIFLKTLVEGNAKLFSYDNGEILRFFIQKDNQNIEQLVYKNYFTNPDLDKNIGNNIKYKEQIGKNLRCADITVDKIVNLKYKKKNLISIVNDYNNCVNPQPKITRKVKNYKPFQLYAHLYENNINIKLENDFKTYDNTDYGIRQGMGMGFGAEYILPFNKNKWGIFTEPSFQYIHVKQATQRNDPNFERHYADINLKTIEIPVGLRYYMYLNKNSSFFIDISYSFAITLNSELTFKYPNGNLYNQLDLSKDNFPFYGIGYKYRAVSLQFQFQRARSILSDYGAWKTKFDSYSIILGYTLFKN